MSAWRLMGERGTNDRAPPPSKKEKPWYQKATKIKSHLQSKLGLSPHKRPDGTSSFKRDWLHSANPAGAAADARMAQVRLPYSAPIGHLAARWAVVTRVGGHSRREGSHRRNRPNPSALALTRWSGWEWDLSPQAFPLRQLQPKSLFDQPEPPTVSGASAGRQSSPPFASAHTAAPSESGGGSPQALSQASRRRGSPSSMMEGAASPSRASNSPARVPWLLRKDPFVGTYALFHSTPPLNKGFPIEPSIETISRVHTPTVRGVPKGHSDSHAHDNRDAGRAHNLRGVESQRRGGAARGLQKVVSQGAALRAAPAAGLAEQEGGLLVSKQGGRAHSHPV